MSKSIHIGARNVNYRDEGKGKPIILLHGWGESGNAWGKIIPLLSTSRRVVIPELKMEFEGYGPESMGDMVADFIEELRLEGAVLVGHDMGARIALETACNYPRHASFVVVVSGWEYDGVPGWTRKLMRFKMASSFFLKRMSKNPERLRKTLREWFYVDPFCVDESTVAAHTLNPEQTTIAGKQMAALIKSTLNPKRLGEIQTPVGIIWGDSDKLSLVSQAWALHRRIEGSQIEVFERCGHCPAIEKPGDFVKTIEKFLS